MWDVGWRRRVKVDVKYPNTYYYKDWLYLTVFSTDGVILLTAGGKWMMKISKGLVVKVKEKVL